MLLSNRPGLDQSASLTAARRLRPSNHSFGSRSTGPPLSLGYKRRAVSWIHTKESFDLVSSVSLRRDSASSFEMADQPGFAPRSMKRKNVKGLALTPSLAPKPPPTAEVQPDYGREELNNTAQLEIGIEYKMDLRPEDLEVLKELGSGNGGTVSKVRHISTGTIMARKVGSSSPRFGASSRRLLTGIRSFTSRPRKRCASESFENFRSCTVAIPST